MVKNYKFFFLTSLLLSAVPLVIAYIAEYLFGMIPCVLCLYQRVPFFINLFLSLIGVKFTEKVTIRRFIVGAILVFLFINSLIAFYNLGVEKNYFAGLKECKSNVGLNVTNIEELKQQLVENSKHASCDKPAFVFMQISIAGWNMIYCIFVIIYLTSLMIKLDGKKET